MISIYSILDMGTESEILMFDHLISKSSNNPVTPSSPVRICNKYKNLTILTSPNWNTCMGTVHRLGSTEWMPGDRSRMFQNPTKYGLRGGKVPDITMHVLWSKI